MSETPFLSVRNLQAGFAPGWQSLLKSVSFSMERGEILGICGESGCGKSLTALSILNLLPENADCCGEILLEGEDLFRLSEKEWRAVRGKRISMIFQDAQQALNPLARVGRQVEESLIIHHPEWNAGERRQRVLEMLDRVGLPDAEKTAGAFPHELSGGMRQRVCCAIALINRPALLIADEPTTALDVAVQEKILNLLRSFRDEYGLAILFISHDLRVVSRFCDRALIYYAGEIVEEGPVKRLFTEPQHVYTRLLLQAMPAKAKKEEALVEIPGRVPSSSDIARHHAMADAPCIFSGRCPEVKEICRSCPPPLVETAPGHFALCHLLSGEDRP